ncbi:MAG: 30S ribosomal protein S11 [Kiritimatiellaeota bacterium]|nr:30S ribosomal protein S11 [Kiritimatiellota bacterium]
MAEEKEKKEKQEAAPPAAEAKPAKGSSKPAKAAKDAPAASGKPAPEGAVAAEGAAEGEAAKAPKKKVKGLRTVPLGIVHIRASFNNTMVAITDMKGAVVAWSSAGRCQFKGSRRSTAYAATVVAQEAAKQAVGHGMREAEVHVQGPGAGRESAIRAIQAAGIAVSTIKDVTPMPHNGCRPPKRRRV